MTRGRNKGIEPGDELAAAVRRAVAKDGESVVQERLGVSGQTLARLGAQMRVNRASVELARIRMGLEAK